MGLGVRFSTGMMAAAALALTSPAAAQFSDGYNFIKAVKDGDGAKVMSFLDKPGQPVLNARDGATGEGALHIVVKRHDINYVNFLLARGAQTEMKDKEGNTPLILAAQLSDVEAVRLLLRHGAQVNARNSRGETPLILAVQARDLPTIRQLVSNGADPKLTDTIAGKSARDYASEDNRGTAVLRALDEAKPKPASVMGPKLPG
jgi:uncharacterized protein